MNGQEQSLMDLFSDPNTIHSLSFGEKMLGSTITMIMGLGITFLILILIWIFIAIMGKVLGSTGGKKKETPAPSAVPAAAPAPAKAEEAASDDSLVAVIAAAVAAFEGDSVSNLVVRRITRLSGGQTPWENAALNARMGTRDVMKREINKPTGR